MTERFLGRALWSAAAAALAAGVVMSVQTARRLDRADARLQRKQAQLAELRKMEQEANRHAAVRRALDALPVGQPASLKHVLAEAFGDGEMPESRDFIRGSVPGWRIREKELIFDEASFARIMAFIERVERGEPAGRAGRRPGWRLAAFTATASGRSAETGRITLRLRALERSDSAPKADPSGGGDAGSSVSR